MIRLLIAADDLTGALDTGVQFSKRGVRTLVARNLAIDFDALDSDFEVLSVDTETRHRDGKAAYDIVYRLIRDAAGHGVEYIYKKTDSALRGNVGAELTAAMDGAGRDRLMFIPAYPGQKRTTENGIQFIDSLPLAYSRFALDPFNPASESNVPDLIRRQADIETTIVKEGENAGFGTRRGIHVFDAKTDGDLYRIGSMLKESGGLRLTAGCAGFAGVLGQMLGFDRQPGTRLDFGGSILLVSGSLDPVSFGQMAFAKKSGFMGASLTPAQKLDGAYSDSPGCVAFTRRILSILGRNRLAYIEAAESESPGAERSCGTGACLAGSCQAGACGAGACRASGYAAPGDPLLIAANIGKIVKRIVDAGAGGDSAANPGKVDNLFVFGGDTLAGILCSLGITEIVPISELCPGVVVSRVASGSYSFNLFTKAGSLGPEDAVGIAASMVTIQGVM